LNNTFTAPSCFFWNISYARGASANGRVWVAKESTPNGSPSVSNGRSKAVTATVNQLCKELRPFARTLVDAFAIPRDWLNCAIINEEAARQEAIWQEDSRVMADDRPGAQAPETEDTATDVQAAPRD